MIYPVTMYAAKCDNCGKEWVDEHNGWYAFTDKISMAGMLADDTEWWKDGDKHYCSNCCKGYDDNDNLIIKEVTP
jgi:hypothetical protein